MKIQLIEGQYRQGDILLVEILTPADAVPENPESSVAVVALGEATGHAHAVYDGAARVMVTPQKTRHLALVRPTALSHEEHSAIPLARDVRTIRQTEWTDANEPIQVAD